MLRAESLSIICSTELSWVPMGKVISEPSEFRTLSCAKNIPKNLNKGIYIVGASLGSDIKALYCAEICAKAGLRHKIANCDFAYSQNEGSPSKSLSGPTQIWKKLKELGIDAYYYFTFIPLDGYTSRQIKEKKNDLLKRINFIGNAQLNDKRRLEDLAMLFRTSLCAEVYESLRQADAHIAAIPTK